MSLRETERKIYNKGNDLGASLDQKKSSSFRQAEGDPFTVSSFGSSDLDQKKEIWMKEQEEKKAKRKKIIKKISIVVAAIISVIGIIWLALYVRKNAFSEDRVSILIAGPEKVKSGESVSFDIDYQNLNRATLKGAVLYLKYSENFKPSGNLQFESEGPSVSKFNVGDITGKTNGKVTIHGKFFGARDALVYLEARLEYKPSTFNSIFTAKANSSVFISSNPLAIEVSGPQNAASGNIVSYVITYQNTGEENFSDLKIKADFPNGFSFSNSEPLPVQENNIWYLGGLTAGQSGQIKINGTISGARDEEKTIGVFIGEIGSDEAFISYGEAQSKLKIIGSPIIVNQTVNGKSENISVNAGELLLFETKYKNTSSIGLRDVILAVEADSPILDYSQIEMRDGKGEFDQKKKTITWKAADVPEFKTMVPGAEGSIAFSIPVKNIIPVAGPNDKNFYFSAIARMDSPDIPTPEDANKVIASNSVAVKLNSKILAGLQGFFNDSEMPNSGPIPLKVGEETTFTLRLKITNISNDVTDAKAAITLAPGIKWKSNFLPRNASVNFNDRTNEFVWNVGSVSSGIGIITDPKEFVFQVGVIPTQNQSGEFAPLVSGVIFSA